MLDLLAFADCKFHYIPVPCGKCIACRVNRSEVLAGEIQREYELSVKSGLNCFFVTLTYSDDYLPEGGSLVVKDVQNFNKRIRKYVSQYRFFACGEYGSKRGRPHYHLCCFVNASENEFMEALGKSWTFGFYDCKLMHRNSPKYISKYVVKFDSREFPDKVKPFILRSQHFGMPRTEEDRKKFIEESISSIRSSRENDTPATYRDILGVRHPYSRKLISQAFTDKEKCENSFNGYFDDYIRRLYVKSGSTLPFEDFRISYILDQEENQDLYFFKQQFYKKFRK